VEGEPRILARMFIDLLLMDFILDWAFDFILCFNFAGRSFDFLFPWAVIICSNFLRAFLESRISWALSLPFPFFALPIISMISPANSTAFCSRSFGDSFLLRTFRMSRISKTGPIPFPMGSFPSVRMTEIFSLKNLPTCKNSFFSLRAFWRETFAPGPYGMSISMCVLPVDIFFERIDAINWDSGSIFNKRSTLISLSSAGASPSAPPQARHALVFFTTCFSSFSGRTTSAIVSIVSTVPAALVIALEEVFGIVIPAAAHIATTIGVVLFPAIPPMECLSAIFFLFQERLLPVFAIASVRYFVSLKDIP